MSILLQAGTTSPKMPQYFDFDFIEAAYLHQYFGRRNIFTHQSRRELLLFSMPPHAMLSRRAAR